MVKVEIFIHNNKWTIVGPNGVRTVFASITNGIDFEIEVKEAAGVRHDGCLIDEQLKHEG